MNTYQEDETATTDERWRAWVQKGKLREAAAARKLRVVAGVVIAVLAAATAAYLILVRQGA
jgi:hypothetical protein